MTTELDFDELLYLYQGHETTGGKKKKCIFKTLTYKECRGISWGHKSS